MNTLKFLAFSAWIALTFSWSMAIQAAGHNEEKTPLEKQLAILGADVTVQSDFPPSTDEEPEQVQARTLGTVRWKVDQHYRHILKHHYRSSQEYRQAMERLEVSAAQGDANAQYTLGNLYRNGQGVQQDFVQAKELYEESAMQGNPDAQYMLGVIYHYGEGIPEDFVQARKWYEKAAAKGNAYAKNGLANIPEDHAQEKKRGGRSASLGEQKLKKRMRVVSWFTKS